MHKRIGGSGVIGIWKWKRKVDTYIASPSASPHTHTHTYGPLLCPLRREGRKEEIDNHNKAAHGYVRRGGGCTLSCPVLPANDKHHLIQQHPAVDEPPVVGRGNFRPCPPTHLPGYGLALSALSTSPYVSYAPPSP